MITTLDEHTALVLIDLQHGIVDMAKSAAAPVVENAARLVHAFRKANLPIVIVNVNPTTSPINALRKEANAPAFEIPGGWLDIVPEIRSTTQDIFITKNTWNAFTNPSLYIELKKRNVSGIVLAGISTSIGVEGTARRASELGYNLTFAQDAMADLFPEAHQHSLKYIFPRIGELGSTKEIIDVLESR